MISVLFGVYIIFSTFVQNLFGATVPTRQIMYISTYEIDKWVVEKEDKCTLCGCNKQE